MSNRLRDMVRIQGALLVVLAVSMTIPFFIALFYSENKAALAFAGVILFCGICGVILNRLISPSPARLKARDGFLVVSVSWFAASLIGALPFVFSGAIPNFADAFFESSSGFSTTGASILSDIEVMPKSILFWRSFTHWLGGMGIIVFIMALLPTLGISGQLVAYAETPGPTKDKITAKFSDTAKDLYLIYFGLTLSEAVLLKIGGMTWFDAFVHTFGTVGTGGFSSYNDSIAHFNSPFIEWVIIIFMFLAGLNFNLFYLSLKRGLKELIHDEEAKFYVFIVCSASFLIAAALTVFRQFETVGASIRASVFQVVSIITTTGYATADYDIWPTFTKILIFVLFFIGGCSSSTSGGIKVVRVLIAARLVKRGISIKLHPNRIAKVTLNDKELSNDVVINIANFIFMYLAILAVGFLLISINGFDFMTSLSASATCLGNIGPGFNSVGPTMNFADFSSFSKVVCSFLMLCGRLEIFTLIVLFTKHYWNPDRT